MLAPISSRSGLSRGSYYGLTRLLRSVAPPCAQAPLITPADAPDVRPLLWESQLANLRRYGDESGVRLGALLFSEGERSYDLIVLLEGKVDIVDHYGRPAEQVLISPGRGSSSARRGCSPVSACSSRRSRRWMGAYSGSPSRKCGP